MQQRYYDPVVGRFYSNDPLGFRDTHSFNRYAYANNNPYKYVDPFGMASEKPNVMEKEEAQRTKSCQEDSLCAFVPVGNRKPVSAKADGKNVVISYDNGSQDLRSGGSRAWRNNNPGNIRNSGFAVRRGSLGEAGGFAVFADEGAGLLVLVNLLGTETYQGLTINEAINRYAPSSENDTMNYQSLIYKFTGLDSKTKLNSLNSEQVIGVANAIKRVEGWQVGTVTLQ